MSNPFQAASLFNRELAIENCQRIFFTAARSAQSQTIDPQEILDDLRVLARLHGPEIYILHPHDIEQMFRGITLAVYQAVRRLFCTPIFRTERTIWQILEAWAREANALAPTAEAVWAICEYLQADRDEEFTSHIEQNSAQWYVGIIQPDVLIQEQGDAPIKPTFIYVANDTPEHVLAFRHYDADSPADEVIAQALYDALISQRHPERLAPNGLSWSVPARLVSAIPLPSDVQACCAALNLPIEIAGSSMALVHDLNGTWTRSLVGRTISAEWFEAIFDNYLEKRHGYGPRKTRDDADYTYRHLQGYNRDPALVVPALRYLLPIEQVTIRDDATIAVAGRRYTDALLASWIGQPVDVRRSRYEPSQVYVYLDGAILCQAQEAIESLEAESPDSPRNR